MTEETNQNETGTEEEVVQEAVQEGVQEQAETEQPKYKQLVFNTQPEAYQFLQHECPKEYTFTAGVDKNSGKRVVVVVLPA